MPKRSKRERNRERKLQKRALAAAGVDPTKDVKLRFTRDGEGGMLIDGMDEESQRAINVALGEGGESVRISEDKLFVQDGQLFLRNAKGNVRLDAVVGDDVDARRVKALSGQPGDPVLNLGATREEAARMVGKIIASQIGFGPGTGAVDTYLKCVRALLEGAQGAIRGLSKGQELNNGVLLSRKLWARMSQARVYELPADHYVSLHKAADTVITQEIGDDGKDPTINRLNEYADKSLGFVMDPLPFENVYLGFGGGIELPMELAYFRFEPEGFPKNFAQYRVLGYLVVDSGVKMAVELAYVMTTGDNFLMPSVLYDSETGGGWRNSMTMAPWIIGATIKLINEHKTLVEEKRPALGQRLEIDRIRKKFKQKQGFIPKPYYRLVLKHETIVNEGRRKDALGPSRTLSYRHDREGHDRCYIRRGPLPLDPVTREKLERAEYRIWTLDRPDAAVMEQLALRGKPPKRADEWLAVLTRWINPQVIGDKGLPYVPATRIPQVRSEGRAQDR